MSLASPLPSAGMSQRDWLSALVVIVVWGLNFVVMKWGLATLSPLLLCALRFVAASLPFVWFVRRPQALPWWLLAAYGLVQGVGQFGLLFTGMKLGMPAGMASVVLQVQAFITMLLAAAFMGEKPQRWQWWGLVCAIAGLALIGAAHGDSPTEMTLAGFLITVGAAAMWASSNLLTRKAAQYGAYTPVGFIVWTSLFPIVPLLALSVGVDGVEAVAQQLQGIGWRELGVMWWLPACADIAAAWEMSDRHGCPLADAVTSAAADLRARRRHDRALEAATAGAKATMGVLVLLPVLGMALAWMLGVDVFEIYSGTSGLLTLWPGLALLWAGATWSQRMVASALKPPAVTP